MQKLIFIYNANSGIGNAIIDITHKIFSPKTYSCNLCAITFDTFSENKTWKDFRVKSYIDMAFFHIDKFEEKYKDIEFIYPVVLIEQDNTFEELLTAEDIKSLNSPEALILEIKKFVNQSTAMNL